MTKKPNFYEVPYPPDKARFKWHNIGLGAAVHNYLCGVCHDKPAVLVMNDGTLQPCWECAKEYQLIKVRWFDKLIGRGNRWKMFQQPKGGSDEN